MLTRVECCGEEAFARAARYITAGEVVGFPTETVYGLGANALCPEAVAKIFAAKGRPADNPLIVHITDINDAAPLISGGISDKALALAYRFWPGPLTMIFKRSELVPDIVTAGLDSVGIRVPSDTNARRFIDACGCPIAAPSANRSGRPSPTTARHVLEDMDGRIPMILDGGECSVGLESTVLDMTGDVPRVLRPGGVTPEHIVETVGECQVDDSVLRPLKDGERPRSPGMKYRHYAPNGSLVIFDGAAEDVARRICEEYDAADGDRLILALEQHKPLYADRRVASLGGDASEMARRLFDALREADAIGASHIFAEAVPGQGIGLAVMNRLGRAAAFHIEKV